MRIVGGQWRGRAIAAPRGRGTRPTSDRVREAVFSAVFSRLGDIDGMDVADLYAGSGALGLEALSRGASHCVFVETDRAAAGVIRANIAALGVSAASADVIQTPVERWAHRAGEPGPVSLLLADPPYRIDASEVSQVLEALAARGFLEHGALVVYEHATGSMIGWPSGFVSEPAREYGSTAVSFARYEG